MKPGFTSVLKKRLSELGLTYEDLARKVGVSGVYISKIVQGRQVPTDEVVFKLARALDLDLERLVLMAHYEKAPTQVKPIFEKLFRHTPAEFLDGADNFENFREASLGRGRPVPVVGLVQAGEFASSEDGEYPAGVADNYVYTDHKGENLFGVQVTNDSMEPEFKEGDVLVINPNLETKNGDYVIVKLTDDNQATFKKLVIHRSGRAPLFILRPLNPAYEDIVITDPQKVRVIGKVVERKTLF